MAADGSVIIEIEGNASELIAEFRRVADAADTIETSVRQIATAFRTATSAAEGLDGAGLDDAAESADELDQGLTEASQAAERLEDSLDGDISGEIDEAARAADNLDDALDDATQAADRLDDSTNGAGGGLGRLRDGFTTLKATAAGVLSDLATRAIDAFVGLGQEALTAADALTKFGSTMEFAGFDSATIESSKAAVQDYAARTVYELETVANTTAQLAANGVADFVGLTEAAGNLNAVAGGNAETFKSVAMALTQTIGAGKLTTENWNQIADAIPGASGKLQEAMRQNGAFVGDFREAMAAGQITAEEFQQAIMDLGMTDAAIEAASSVATIEGAVGNLKATIVDGITGILTDSGGMEAITGFINGLTSVFETAGTYIGPMIDMIRTSIGGVGEAFRNAFTPEQQAAILGFLQNLTGGLLSVPFGLVATAVNVLSTGFQALITAGGAVADFFAGFPEGLLAAGTAFDNFKASVAESFSEALSQASEWGSNLLASVSDSASGAVEAVSTFFSELPGNIEQFVSNALDRVITWASDLVSQATEAGSEFLSGVGEFLSSLPENVRSWIEGAIQRVVEWGTEMKTNAESKMEEVKTAIKTKLESLPDDVFQIGRDIVQGLINGISEKIELARQKASELASAVKGKLSTAFDTNSPSRWAEDQGVYIDQGLGIGLKKGIKYATDGAEAMAEATKEEIDDLNAEIEKMEIEAAERQAKAEQEAHEKALAEQYKKLEEAELDKREEIQEKITDLEADWAEKQLKKQEEAQKKALESRIDALETTEKAYEDAMGVIQDALEDFNDEYQDALEDVANSRDSLAGELSDFALYDDFEGEMHLWDLGPMIDQINEYGDVIAELQDRGVNESLLNEILEMDRSEATRFGQELIAMSEDQYAQYMAMWQEKEDAAARVAASIYQGEMDAIETEYAEKLPEMMAETADEAMTTLAEHLEGTGQDAVAAIANITDQIIAEIERINAVQTLQAAVQGASMSFGGKLTSNVQNAAEGSAAARRSQTMETAGAVAMATNTNSSREIVLNLNGKEVARGLVPDIRSVEDQSPRIVSD